MALKLATIIGAVVCVISIIFAVVMVVGRMGAAAELEKANSEISSAESKVGDLNDQAQSLRAQTDGVRKQVDAKRAEIAKADAQKWCDSVTPDKVSESDTVNGELLAATHKVPGKTEPIESEVCPDKYHTVQLNQAIDLNLVKISVNSAGCTEDGASAHVPVKVTMPDRALLVPDDFYNRKSDLRLRVMLFNDDTKEVAHKIETLTDQDKGGEKTVNSVISPLPPDARSCRAEFISWWPTGV